MKQQILKYKSFVIFCFIFLGVAFSCHITGFDATLVWERKQQLVVLFQAMFPPDFSYQKAIYPLLLSTVAMSIVGTSFGTAVGMLLSLALSKQLHKENKLIFLLRSINNFLRAIPTLILALLSTFLFGFGSFAGTFAIFIYTMAIMTRIGYEDLDSADYTAYDALCAAGIKGNRAFTRTIFLEFLPGFLANALYLLESNVRQATILGYVGAGGIGLLLHEKIAWREYGKLGMILCLLYVVVILLETGSIGLLHLLHKEDFLGKLGKLVAGLGFLMLLLISVPAIDPPKCSASGIRIIKSMGYGLLHPDTNLLFGLTSGGVLSLLVETICIALLGTLLGAILAFLLSLAASTRFFSWPIAMAVRAILTAIRTVPVLIYGFMFIRVVGPGSFAGVLTLGISSVGLLSKRFIVAIDGMDLAPVEALKAMGCPRRSYLVRAVIPILSPALLSAVAYRFDINLREASILGIVGAGGIGAPLVFAINNYKWSQVSALLLGLLILLFLIDSLSSHFRQNSI